MPTVGQKKIRAVVKVASWQSSGRHFGRRFGNRVALGEVLYDFAWGSSRGRSLREISNPPKFHVPVVLVATEKFEKFPLVRKVARKNRTRRNNHVQLS